MKTNDQIVYDFLKSQTSPVQMSFSTIREKIKFKRKVYKKVIDKTITWKPSRKGVDDSLKRLEKLGMIKRDYRVKTNPKIIIK